MSAEGEPQPGVTITVRGEVVERSTLSDVDGRFRFAGLPPGQYQVRANFAGYTTWETAVNLTAGGASSVDVMFGGPVSPGEPSPTPGDGPQPTPTPEPTAAPTPEATVTQQRLEDDMALQEWLNSEASDGRDVQAIVPLQAGVSLFVCRQRAPAARCTVIVDHGCGGQPEAERLQIRIRQHDESDFVGVHLLADGTPALVFCDVN